MKVLANDGISKEGVDKLNSAGFKTIVESIDQSEIIDFINNNSIEVLLVRSATKVRKDLIDSCKNLKITSDTKYKAKKQQSAYVNKFTN